MISESLYAFITADASIKAALGSTRSDKTTGVFPGFAPGEPTTPYMTYQQIGGSPLQESFAGTGALKTARYRLSCYGSSYKQAKNLANVVSGAMLSMDGTQSGGSEVHGSWLKFEGDDFEPIPHGTLYGCHVDFEINYLDTE